MRSVLGAALTVAVFSTTAGCTSEDDCTFEDGRRYRVDLLEPYDASSSFAFDPTMLPSGQGGCASQPPNCFDDFAGQLARL